MHYSSPPHPNIKSDSKIVLECIKSFEETGQTGAHSPAGGILCHLMNHCIRKGISFQLSYLAGGGYSLQKKDWEKELIEKAALGVTSNPTFEVQIAGERCEHGVQEQTAKWHRYHRRREPDRCQLGATISFNGKLYCRGHAGIEALSVLMAESRQELKE